MMNKKMITTSNDEQIPWTTEQYRAYAEDIVSVWVKHGLYRESDRAAELAVLMEMWERKPYVEVITNYKRDRKE